MITKNDILEQADAIANLPVYDPEIGITESQLIAAYNELKRESDRMAVIAVKFANQ